MSTSELLVTPAQRDRAVEILQEMYADDRLTRLEFDVRLEQALKARTRAELNASFDGLLARPVPTYAPVAFSRPGPVQRYDGKGRGLGTVAHWLGYPTFFVGPALIAASAKDNPPVRRHAVEALNFQLTTLGTFMLLGILAGITHGFTWFLFPLVGMVWFVLTGIAGLATLLGNDFRYPFSVRLLR